MEPLTPAEELVMYLRTECRLPHHEIAVVIDVPVNEVESLVVSALDRLASDPGDVPESERVDKGARKRDSSG